MSVKGPLPAHEKMRDILINQIQEGILPPGSTLPSERKLAEKFGVSRHTVRQALSAIEGFGLVTIKHGSGAHVTETVSDAAINRVSMNIVAREGSVPRVVEVRRALEPYMARLAAERHDESFLARLKPLISYDRESPSGEIGQEGTSFHREIAKAAGNPVFDGVLRTLISGPRRAETILDIAPEYRETWENEHLEIYEAIMARDGDLAEQLMAEHLDTVLNSARKFRLFLS